MPTQRLPLVGVQSAKACTKCGVVKGAESFAKYARNRSGLQPRCKDCYKLYRAENREAISARNKIYREKNKERLGQQIKDWAQKNKERRYLIGKAYEERNRSKRREQRRVWRINNPEKAKLKAHRWINSHKEQWKAAAKAGTVRLRAAIKKQQIAKTFAIFTKLIYQTCPAGHHVDHIVPLRGKTVSGLHVPWNLQYLPAARNWSKGNRYE